MSVAIFLPPPSTTIYNCSLLPLLLLFPLLAPTKYIQGRQRHLSSIHPTHNQHPPIHGHGGEASQLRKRTKQNKKNHQFFLVFFLHTITVLTKRRGKIFWEQYLAQNWQKFPLFKIVLHLLQTICNSFVGENTVCFGSFFFGHVFIPWHPPLPHHPPPSIMKAPTASSKGRERGGGYRGSRILSERLWNL